MKRDQLIRIHSFPAVVQAAHVHAIRRDEDLQAANDFVASYLGYDSRARHALSEAVTCLSQRERGGAFWLNGVFGCGKSHLLGVLALLSAGYGRETFAVSHPFLGPLVSCIPDRLVLHFSLDEYDAERWSLEAAFWRELELEWGRKGLGDLNIVKEASRGEVFTHLLDDLTRRGFQGLVICLDELSLFLGGREHHGLQADAAFLQFLGQFSRRAPLHLFAALQKNVDDIAGIEAYSLGQIRDRFTTLSLSLANLPAILEQRVVEVVDSPALEGLCDWTWSELNRALPRQDFGPSEWRAHYPFHPATLGLLEQVVARFFSRTRSAVLFMTQTAATDGPAEERVGPDTIWDYFEPELDGHPDLRPLSNIWQTWRDEISEIAGRSEDEPHMVRVMKFVLLCKVAGLSATVAQVANALNLNAGLAGDGNYEYARYLLERLRSRAAFLAVERGDDPLLDRYAVDTGQRVGEMLRRHLQASLETLDAEDSRVPSAVLLACREEPLPLAELESGPRSYSIFWHNTPRRLQVEIWKSGAVDALNNRLCALCEPGAQDDALLVVLPPYSRDDLDLESVTSVLPEEFQRALWFWKPRGPLKDELTLAREVTAARLLESDPQLLDNRRGRAVLEKLRAEAPGRELQLQRVALRLLREGMLYLGHGPVLEAAELAASETWTGLLEAVADFAMPQLYEGYAPLAPRARLLTPSNADALCLEILRRPSTEPYFAPSLERLARHIGEPLGVASASAGRWRITSPQSALRETVMARVACGVTLAGLESELAKRPWGLRPEQTAIVVCALLREGEALALDSRGQELVPAQIGLPLRRSVHTLKPGQLVSASIWDRIGQLAAILGGFGWGALTFEQQDAARDWLLSWRENVENELNLSQARCTQLRRQLGHSADGWPEFTADCEVVAAMIQAIPASGTAMQVLERAAQTDSALVQTHLLRWRSSIQRLESRLHPLLTGYGLLAHPELNCPGDIVEQRTTLLLRLGDGEKILWDDDLPGDMTQWATTYQKSYAAWHAAQHNGERWNSLRRLVNSDQLKALERLATLTNRPFPWGPRVRESLEAELGKFLFSKREFNGGRSGLSFVRSQAWRPG